MKWILGVLIVATVVLTVLAKDLLWPVVALPFALGCLGAAWLCERRLPAGRSRGLSAAVFGVTANVVGTGFQMRLLALPYGSSFDSLDAWWLIELSFFFLAGAAGVALALRGLVRAQVHWKLLALAGLALSLTPGVVSHKFFLWVVETRGLQDLW